MDSPEHAWNMGLVLGALLSAHDKGSLGLRPVAIMDADGNYTNVLELRDREIDVPRFTLTLETVTDAVVR